MIAAFVLGYGCGALATLCVAVFRWREQQRKHEQALVDVWRTGWHAGRQREFWQ